MAARMVMVMIMGALGCAAQTPSVITSDDGSCWRIVIIKDAQVGGAYPIGAVQVPCREEGE